MYATIHSGTVIYLGVCRDTAYEAAHEDDDVFQVNTLEELAIALRPKEIMDEAEAVLNAAEAEYSRAFDKLVNKLDECGINKELAEKIKANGEKLVGEAKSLGIRGMRAVGSGFVALGDLLRKAGEKEEEEIKERAGDHHDCCGH
jgi:hypothetical protein